MTQNGIEENVKAEVDATHSRMTRSAGVVSAAVMLSRVLGLAREMVLASMFEAKTSLDAFKAAFTIPNFLRDLFGEGILSKAFVTTFKDVENRSGEDAAWRLTNLVFNALAIVLTALTIIGIALSPLTVNAIFVGRGFDTKLPPDIETSKKLLADGDPAGAFRSLLNFGFEDKRELTIYLTRIMFPFLLLVCMAAIAMGLLNSKGRFGVPASASAFFNLGSVLVGIWGYYAGPKLGQHPVVGMAVGVLAGGLLQFLIQTPSMWRVGFRYRPVLSFRDPDLKQVMKLMAPAILGNAALQVNLLFNRFFASQGEGWLAWNELAFRIMHFPIGIVGVPISTASLPVLSQFAARGSMDEYKQAFAYALKMVFILALPAAAGLIFLSKPITSLIYERGKFGAEDTIRVAGALLSYAFGLCGYAGRQIATDGFIALKDMRTPVIVSLFTIALNILLNGILIFGLGIDHRSLAISTACSITVNFVLVLELLRRRVSGLGRYGLGSVFVRSVVASGCMGVIILLSYNQLSGFVGSRLSLLVVIIAAAPVLYALYRVLKVREFDLVVRAIMGKIRVKR